MRKRIVSIITLVLVAVFLGGTCLANDVPVNNNYISIHHDIVYNSEAPRQQTLDIFMQSPPLGVPNYDEELKKLRPTVIYTHGGGWIEGDKTRHLDFKPYLDAGFNVVNINYRQGANTAPNAVFDVLYALKWVTENAETYKIDLQNIIMSGDSAGAHLALISAFLNTTTTPEKQHEKYYVGDKIRIRAVVNFFGISDIAEAEKYLAKNKKNNFAKKWIGNKDVATISKDYSPIYYINANTPPIITFHGTKDTVVPFIQNENLHKELEKFNVTNYLEPVKNRNHGDFSPNEWKQVYELTMDFLNIVMNTP